MWHSSSQPVVESSPIIIELNFEFIEIYIQIAEVHTVFCSYINSTNLD